MTGRSNPWLLPSFISVVVRYILILWKCKLAKNKYKPIDTTFFILINFHDFISDLQVVWFHRYNVHLYFYAGFQYQDLKY